MLNDNIFIFRRLSGLTRSEMARALNISVKKYAQIESGKTDCDERIIENIAAVLNVSTDELCSGTISEKLNMNMSDSIFEFIEDPEIAEYMRKSLAELTPEDRAMLLLIRRINDKSRAEQLLMDIIMEQEEDFL